MSNAGMLGGGDALITVHTILPRFPPLQVKTGNSWDSFFFFFKDNLYADYFTHLVGFDHESVDHLFARFHEESLVSLIQK